MNHGESLSRKYPITVISKVQIDEHHDSCHLFIFIFCRHPQVQKGLIKPQFSCLNHVLNSLMWQSWGSTSLPWRIDPLKIWIKLWQGTNRGQRDSHASSSPTVILETWRADCDEHQLQIKQLICIHSVQIAHYQCNQREAIDMSRCRSMVVCPPLNLADRRKIKALKEGLKTMLETCKWSAWIMMLHVPLL